MKKKIAIIGAGFSGLSAAAYAAQAGNEVHVFEKHDQPGGRARQFKTENGYAFDMGPSWYWMPDIIDDFFIDFGVKTSNFFKLKSLDPQFEMLFSDEKIAVPKSFLELKELFENMEKGSGRQLEKFMESARYKYQVGMQDFVNKPCYTWAEFMSPKIASHAFKLDLLSNFRSYVSKYFSNTKLQALMEFPVIFLGASPKDIPALYSLMNYGGYVLGTKYPMGGFYQLVLAMKTVAEKEGVFFHFNSPVEKIIVENGRVTSLKIDEEILGFDVVIASSDYQHSESLLPKKYRNYNEGYWKSRTFAPSCLIYYLGVNKKIHNIQHHTLFFEEDISQHSDEIYKNPKWPSKPLFYVCCPSQSDHTVAPFGHENLFLLMPLATGLEDNEELREKYFKVMLNRLENHVNEELATSIDYKKSYCLNDFIEDYNSYKGNAYGLANTLMQTAVLKPKIRNKKVKNLFYAGQLTVPGPGVPPSIISGKIAAEQVAKHLKTKNNETVV